MRAKPKVNATKTISTILHNQSETARWKKQRMRKILANQHSCNKEFWNSWHKRKWEINSERCKKTNIFIILMSVKTLAASLLESRLFFFSTDKAILRHKEAANPKNTQEALSAEIWRRRSSEGTAVLMLAAPQISTKQIIFSSMIRPYGASWLNSEASLKINGC